MNVNFATHINKKPTYFIEKIFANFHKNIWTEELAEELTEIISDPMNPMNWDLMIVAKLKIHTIRRAKSSIWETDNMIQFVINDNTKKRFQFAPETKILGFQKIEIHWDASHRIDIDSDNETHKLILKGEYGRDSESDLMIFIDNTRLPVSQWEVLAINDGFDSLDEFLNYFNQYYVGKIIHWTDFKY